MTSKLCAGARYACTVVILLVYGIALGVIWMAGIAKCLC